MNEIRKTENAYMNLMNPVMDEISPYSAEYPVELLSNGLKLKFASFRRSTNFLATTVRSSRVRR